MRRGVGGGDGGILIFTSCIVVLSVLCFVEDISAQERIIESG